MSSNMIGGIPLPFSGIEYSGHEVELDKALSPYESDEKVLSYTSEMLLDFANVYVASASKMLGEFVDENLGVDSIVLDRPIWSNDYASGSDVILVKASPKLLNTIHEKIMKNHNESFKERVAEELSVRSGFAPFYSDDLSDWGDFSSWEEAQIGLLLKEAMNQVSFGEEPDAWNEDVIKRMKKDRSYTMLAERHHESMV